MIRKHIREKFMRGFFAVGIEGTKNSINVGTLWRSAFILGASYIFTVGKRYPQQPSDTPKSWKHIPLFHYGDMIDFVLHMPHDCRLVGVEMEEEAVPLKEYVHFERSIYLLGAEDNGLSQEALKICHDLVVLPGERSLNVSTAGSIVLYDRVSKDS